MTDRHILVVAHTGREDSLDAGASVTILSEGAMHAAPALVDALAGGGITIWY